MKNLALAQKIEIILEDYQRPVRVIRAVDAPQVTRYQVELLNRTTAGGERGAKTRVAHLTQLCGELSAELGRRVSISSGVDGVWVEVAKQNPQTVYANAIPLNCKMELPLVLGVGLDGNPVALDLANPSTPNILVGGTTGSGKSVLLHAMIYSLVKHTRPTNTRLILIDTNSPPADPQDLSLEEGDGLGVWADHPHVSGVLRHGKEVVEMLVYLKNLLKTRYTQPGSDFTKYVVVNDELADLLLDPIYGQDIHCLLTEILQICRKKSVHVIAATQRPSVDVVRGVAKANFPVRIALAVASNIDSRVILDAPGAENLAGKGDAILKIGMKTTRFQTGLTTDDDVWEGRQEKSGWLESRLKRWTNGKKRAG